MRATGVPPRTRAGADDFAHFNEVFQIEPILPGEIKTTIGAGERTLVEPRGECGQGVRRLPQPGLVADYADFFPHELVEPLAHLVEIRRTRLEPERPLGAADPDLKLHAPDGSVLASTGPPHCTIDTPQDCVESFTPTLAAGEHVLEVYEWTNTNETTDQYPPIGRTCFDVTVTR